MPGHTVLLAPAAAGALALTGCGSSDAESSGGSSSSSKGVLVTAGDSS